MAEEIKFAKSLVEFFSILLDIGKRQQYTHDQLDILIDQTYSSFNKIHTDYLNSFQRYRKIIESSEYPLDKNNPIFDMIKEDSRASETERVEIINTAGAFRKKGRGNTSTPIDDFASSIIYYLLNIRDAYSEKEYRPDTNRIRNNFLDELNLIFGASDSDMKNWDKAIFAEWGIWDPSNEGCHIDSKLVQKEMDNKCEEFGIDKEDSKKHKNLKKALAKKAIENIVNRIRDEHIYVHNCYLKAKLSGI